MYLLFKDPEGACFNSEPGQNIGMQGARGIDECLKNPLESAQSDADMKLIIMELRSENSMLKVNRLHCTSVVIYLFIYLFILQEKLMSCILKSDQSSPNGTIIHDQLKESSS